MFFGLTGKAISNRQWPLSALVLEPGISAAGRTPAQHHRASAHESSGIMRRTALRFECALRL